MENELLHKDLILLQVKEKDQKSLLEKMTSLLYEKGYVKDTFLENILKRESTYPTGLDTGEIKVAIPHTNAEYVNKACICFATLENPVLFHDMSDPKQSLEINMVFMLAVKDPSKQVPLLTQLMSVFSDKETLQELYQAQDTELVYNKIKEILNLKEEK